MSSDSTLDVNLDEEARRRFEAAWRAGAADSIERFLPPEDHAFFLATLEELVAIEMEFRWKEATSLENATPFPKPRVEEYLIRFPQLDQPEVLERLLSHESSLRQQRGESFSRVETRVRALEIVDTVREEESAVRTVMTPALPGYEIIHEIARGGMGVVYKARQIRLNRLVAVKMILAGANADPSTRARFQTEAEAVASLRHPNIVQIHEVGEQDGAPYLSLEFMDGGTLAKKTAHTPQPPRVAAEIIEILARTIDFAHSRGIVHRDLKPANIMMSADGTLKITDFGLARRLEVDAGQTKSGEILGSVSYMAPEQAAPGSGIVGPPADIYALGAILYELLAGWPPFQGETPWDVLAKAISTEPISLRRLQPKTPADLETICLKCLHKKPHRRYASARALADDLHCFLTNRPIQARPAGTLERFWRWSRRNPALAAAVFLTAALVALSIGFGIIQGYTAETLRFEQKHTKAAEEKAQRLVRNLQETDRQRVRLSRLSARLVLDQGQTRCEQGDVATGMVSMAHGLEIVPENAPELAATMRLNLGSWRGELRPLRGIMPHDDIIRTAAFAPDGKTLLTASDDGTARLWNTATSAPIGQAMRHGNNVLFAIFSPNGAKVLTGSTDKTARIWDAKTGLPIGAPLLLKAAGKPGAFSPDGKMIAVGCYDQLIRRWDADTGAAIGEPFEHPGGVRALSFSADGETLLSGGDGGTARMWDAKTGHQIGAIMHHPKQVYTASFSPDGQTVLTSCWNGKVRLWHAATGQPRDVPELMHGDRVDVAIFSGDGRTILTGSFDRTARLWNAATGEPIGAPMKHLDSVCAVAFSPDGQTVATGSYDWTARVWDAATGEPLGPPLKHGNLVRSVAFSPDGERLLTASLDNLVRVWDAKTGNPGSRVLPHRSVVTSARFHPDGKMIATGGYDGKIKRWDTETLQPVDGNPSHDRQIYSVDFSPDGKWLLSGSWDKSARLWDAKTGKAVTPKLEHGAEVFTARFSPDGRHIATAGADFKVRLWNVATGAQVLPPMQHEAAVWYAAFSPDGTLLATTGYDRAARLWDLKTGKLRRALLHQSPVWGVTFSPDGKTLLTACWDRTARQWDVETGRVNPIVLPHRDWVMSVVYSPNGSIALTGSKDATARLWDPLIGQPIGPVLRHQAEVSAVAWSPDGRTFLTAGEDQTARLWRAPVPVEGTVERIKLWVQVITGMELDDDGVARMLDGPTWKQRDERLQQLGGPPTW